MTAGNLIEVTCHLPNPTAAGLSPNFRLSDTATPPYSHHQITSSSISRHSDQIGIGIGIGILFSSTSAVAASVAAFCPSSLFFAAQICLFDFPLTLASLLLWTPFSGFNYPHHHFCWLSLSDAFQSGSALNLSIFQIVVWNSCYSDCFFIFLFSRFFLGYVQFRRV